jgi:hypothetical protein
MMNRHFSYLLEENDNEFFDKIAHERNLKHAHRPNITSAPRAEMQKVAAMDKLAARVDSDIEIIKMAGQSGGNFGAIIRGNDYMNQLLDRGLVSQEVGDELFDKVAGATIEHDVSIIESELAEISGHPEWAKFAAADIGTDLVEAMMLEKEAFLAAAPAMARLGLGAKVVRGLGKPGRSIARFREGRAVKKLQKAEGKLMKRKQKAETLATRQKGRAESAKKIKDPRVRASMAGHVERQTARITKRQDRLIGKKTHKRDRAEFIRNKRKPPTTEFTGPKVPSPSAKKPAAPPVADTARQQQNLSTKTQSDQGKARLEQAKADDRTARAAKGSEKGKKGKEKGEGIEDMTDQATHEVGYGKSLAEFRDKGWAKLSPEEKNKVLQAAGGAYMAHQYVS